MHLPNDCTLIPTQGGALAVSPSLGTFCAVMPDELEAFQALLDHRRALTKLPPQLRERLDKHGFFGNPRPYRKPRQLLQFQVTNACNVPIAVPARELLALTNSPWNRSNKLLTTGFHSIQIYKSPLQAENHSSFPGFSMLSTMLKANPNFLSEY